MSESNSAFTNTAGSVGGGHAGAVHQLTTTQCEVGNRGDCASRGTDGDSLLTVDTRAS